MDSLSGHSVAKSAIAQLDASSARHLHARRGPAATGRGQSGPRCVGIVFLPPRLRLAACRAGLQKASLTSLLSQGADVRSDGNAEICCRLLGGRWRGKEWEEERGTYQGSGT